MIFAWDFGVGVEQGVQVVRRRVSGVGAGAWDLTLMDLPSKLQSCRWYGSWFLVFWGLVYLTAVEPIVWPSDEGRSTGRRLASHEEMS